MGASVVVREVTAWLIVTAGLLYAASVTPRVDECSGTWGCLLDILQDHDFHFRCAISLPIAALIYLSCGLFANTMFPRVVVERGARPPIYSWWRLDGDMNWSLVGLVAGTPMIQIFHHASDRFGAASGMLLYKDPLQYGAAWALLQIPVYLFLWDFFFYVLHRWVLHHHALYKFVHSGHHAFRPPTAWAGIAVGPVDVVFEGILPYVLPLFCRLPFHEYSVNAVNAVLTLHALVLHSACHRDYAELSGVLGWLMISPVGHNMHHQYGEVNACNFAPIFKIWDRALGTLNDGEPFWWESDRKAAAKAKASAKGIDKLQHSHGVRRHKEE
jgi:sterol desaturase/sphingolipid hydroxylase (fatty acid hydroxylase superfamily)